MLLRAEECVKSTINKHRWMSAKSVLNAYLTTWEAENNQVQIQGDWQSVVWRIQDCEQISLAKVRYALTMFH